MKIDERLLDWLRNVLSSVDMRPIEEENFAELCSWKHIAKLYYDFDLGEDTPYRNKRMQELIAPGSLSEKTVIIYDSGRKPGYLYSKPFYLKGSEYCHVYIAFNEEIDEADVDKDLCDLMIEILYIYGSRINMQKVIEYAETTDPQTGIPNIICAVRKYDIVTKTVPGENYVVLYINIRNFKYLNEIASTKCGDEAITKYSHILTGLVGEDECVCRMGGDNFVMFIRREHLEPVMSKLHCINVSGLKSAPGRSFELAPWIGVSPDVPGDKRPLNPRLGEAAMACNLGKTRLKQDVVFFSEELKMMMIRSREIMAMFLPAVRNHEFRPFFQPKVDMRSGKLIGMEALCRWVHDGKFIYPDQFIPVLDKEGLIHDLDITIFRETCAAIKRWKDMGLNPPRISSNFSRKNLFVQDIEDEICRIIEENGISVENVEIEITESVQESETERLIGFVRNLKSHGLHIAIDDFGTGYSSLMLIHNIDADVIKIDKSFVDEIPGDRKSTVLIESIISIAHNLGMTTIAEGVETAEQGRALMRLGCSNAQGYYFSKPVDFDTATQAVERGGFAPIDTLRDE